MAKSLKLGSFAELAGILKFEDPAEVATPVETAPTKPKATKAPKTKTSKVVPAPAVVAEATPVAPTENPSEVMARNRVCRISGVAKLMLEASHTRLVNSEHVGQKYLSMVRPVKGGNILFFVYGHMIEKLRLGERREIAVRFQIFEKINRAGRRTLYVECTRVADSAETTHTLHVHGVRTYGARKEGSLWLRDVPDAHGALEVRKVVPKMPRPPADGVQADDTPVEAAPHPAPANGSETDEIWAELPDDIAPRAVASAPKVGTPTTSVVSPPPMGMVDYKAVSGMGGLTIQD